LDPFNPVSRTLNGFVLVYERRYAEAIEELEEMVRLGPENLAAVGNLAWAYHLNGDYDKALEMQRRYFPGDQELEDALDRGYAEGGYQTAMLRLAETLAARPEAAERLGYTVAGTYAWAGEKERTLEWLETAYQAHEPNLMNVVAPDFELVHDDPRFHDLLRRMNLPIGPEGN
jgi:tetratricopeptide (TPR) repeat protein